MEKEIDKIKDILEKFIEKYQIKTLKINTSIEYHSKLNTENPKKWVTEENPKKWVTEYYSTVNRIDINLTK